MDVMMPAGQTPLSEDSIRAQLVARADRARVRAEARLTGTIADFFLDADARLDERTRLTLAHVLGGIVAAIEADVRRHAARVLAGAGAIKLGETMLASEGVMERLTRAGILRHDELMDELIARVRHDLIADSLPVAIAGPDEASLLVRLASVPDSVVASAASALLAAESRRRAANEHATMAGSELPAELHHRLVWWVAAAIRGGLAASADVDRAITEAALRSLGAHDEGERPEAVAMRLASAIDARPDELAGLLIEAIGDRRLSLFVAVLAQATGMAFDQARAITIEPEGDRLWLALRAADLDRTAIATIGLALSDADPRRDIEAFADQLDAIAMVDMTDARSALAPLTLHRDFRAALRALARSNR